MLALSSDDLIELSSPLELIAAVEMAARSWEAGSAIVPRRLHTEWDGNTLLTMPAVSDGIFGTKLVSVVPGNAVRGLHLVCPP